MLLSVPTPLPSPAPHPDPLETIDANAPPPPEEDFIAAVERTPPPLRVLTLVLRRADAPQLVAAATMVCRAWAAAARHPRVWRALLGRHFPQPGATGDADEEEEVEEEEGSQQPAEQRDWRRSYRTRHRIVRRRNDGGDHVPYGTLHVEFQATYSATLLYQ